MLSTVPTDWMEWFRQLWNTWPADIHVPTAAVLPSVFFDGLVTGQVYVYWEKDEQPLRRMCDNDGNVDWASLLDKDVVALYFRFDKERSVFCNFSGQAIVAGTTDSNCDIPSDGNRLISTKVKTWDYHFCLVDEGQRQIFFDILRRNLY